MPRDSGELDAALVGLLQGDAALTALQPDGVWLDDVPPGAQRFVMVAVLEATDGATFGAGRAFEVVRYRVTAVGHTAVVTGPEIRAAALRIDTLLQDAALTVGGYPAGVTIARLGRVRLLEVDDEDRSLRWYHRGGVYELFAPN
jgi:hypothetical protein